MLIICRLKLHRILVVVYKKITVYNPNCNKVEKSQRSFSSLFKLLDLVYFFKSTSQKHLNMILFNLNQFVPYLYLLKIRQKSQFSTVLILFLDEILVV